MKKILVTGGAGFLGSHLVKRLLKDRKNQVAVLDNLFTGRKSNLEEVSSDPHFTFYEEDITHMPEGLEEELGPLDEIYHAACPASPVHYQESPTRTTKTCVVGTIHMLELARKYGAKLLQFSTSEVYGDPFVHPQREDYKGAVNPIGIRSCYDEGKRCAESLCFDYHREFGVRTKVVRIFNTYGPYMDPGDGRVVSNFIMQALKGEDITIYGDGCQTRSFCYVDDLIEGIQRMMDTKDSFLGPVNLGNPEEFTVRALAEIIIQKTGSPSRLRFRNLPQDDPKQRRPDIALAKETLGYSPQISLDQGLDHTISYFSSLTSLPDGAGERSKETGKSLTDKNGVMS